MKKRIQWVAAGVTLATQGCGDLGDCTNCGAVDPPPEPFVCSDGSDGILRVIGTLAGEFINLRITSRSRGHIGELALEDPVNVTVAYFVFTPGEREAAARLVLNSADVTEGSVRIRVTEAGGNGTECPTGVGMYSFVIEEDGLLIESASGLIDTQSTLAMPVRDSVTIQHAQRPDGAIELDATTKSREASRLEWTVSGGSLTPSDEGPVLWRLPDEPGFYQAEAVLHYDGGGFAVDTVVVEVPEP